MNDTTRVLSREAVQQDLEDIVTKSHVWDGRNLDNFLQSLVNVVNEDEIEFGVTLQVGGTTISGTLISFKKYFATFADEFADAWPSEGRENVRKGILSLGASPEVPEDGTEVWKNPAQFVHLKDARVFTANSSFPTGGTLWRGKLSAVEGFSLGSLSSAD